MQNGFAHDPKDFLTDLKTRGEVWSAMNAARLVMGKEVADGMRDDLGEHWLKVMIITHLNKARDSGEWSFAHSTLQTWIDWKADRITEAEYFQRLTEHAEDGKRDFLPVH